MRIYKTACLLFLLSSTAVMAFDVDKVIEHQDALLNELEPFQELQNQHIDKETEKMIASPGYRPNMDLGSVREATIRIVGQMITTREQAVADAMASVDRSSCREAITDYRNTTLANLKSVYQDYVDNKEKAKVSGNLNVVQAHAVDSGKLHAGPLLGCGEYWIPAPPTGG
ncbi:MULTISPECIES: hypothetical protein [unclassified Endozoicomonas]